MILLSNHIIFKALKHISILLLFLILVRCNPPDTETGNQYASQYVGSESCRACHEQEYNEWKGSHHDNAFDDANESTVLGAFTGKSIKHYHSQYDFYRRNDSFFVSETVEGKKPKEYFVRYTFGVEPLQQYLVDFPDGKYQVFPAAWNTIKEQWFIPYHQLSQDTSDWFHWRNGMLNWNSTCAACHSTNVQKGFNEEANSYHTTFDINDVSCEACHGPGAGHIANPESKYYKNDGITRFLGLQSHSEQINECAACHSRRVELTDMRISGKNYHDQYIPTLIVDPYYEADGQILDEVFVYGSYVQSKMHMNGIKCTDCHNPHTNQLKLPGNQTCMPCHQPAKYDTPEHHFHEAGTEGSKCVDCHMPGKIYMGNDFRRDHSMRVPRPDISRLTGASNACNNCHDDKSYAWAENVIQDHFGKADTSHYFYHLAMGRINPVENVNHLNALLTKDSVPDILRATAIQLMTGATSDQANQFMLQSLHDQHPLVRHASVLALSIQPLNKTFNTLIKQLTDPSRSVRIAAFNAIASVPENNIPDSLKSAYNTAKQEFFEYIQANADFTSGQLMKGQYYQKTNQLAEARKAYLKALEINSLYLPARMNLGLLYNQQNKNQEAIHHFKTVTAIDPENGSAFYSLGLLYAETKQLDKSIDALKKARKLMPDNPSVYYNLGTALMQDNQFGKAKSTIDEALKKFPGNKRIENLSRYLQQEMKKQTSMHDYINQELKTP